MTMLPATYGYARISKADDDARNLETQLKVLDDYGVRPNLVYQDVATGRSLARSGWQELMEVVRPGAPSPWPSWTGSAATSRRASASRPT